MHPKNPETLLQALVGVCSNRGRTPAAFHPCLVVLFKTGSSYGPSKPLIAALHGVAVR